MVHKQRGKPGEMGKAVAIPPDKEAEKKEMFKVNHKARLGPPEG